MLFYLASFGKLRKLGDATTGRRLKMRCELKCITYDTVNLYRTGKGWIMTVVSLVISGLIMGLLPQTRPIMIAVVMVCMIFVYKDARSRCKEARSICKEATVKKE